LTVLPFNAIFPPTVEKGDGEMKCPQCHAENNDSSRFCSNCAAPLGQAGPAAASLTKTLETPVHVMKLGSLFAGKYKILEEIGHGGMGVVYKAEDVKLKRSVALKFLPPHLMDSPELKERFIIEAQAAAALNHPNICVIHEVGESEDRPYIAMEYVDGETLRDKLRAGPLKPQEALDIAIQITSGLGEAHRKGIIHRDIKSANIMVTEKGQAKVMDFGLAKLRGGSSLTKSQTTLGTVAYMSPEQARGDELDQRTDLWSLGVVLYEMLTGEVPFKGDRDVSIIYSIVHEEPKSLRVRKPPVPEELQQVIARALKKNREARYGSADDMLKDLKAYQTALQMEGSGVLNLKTLGRRLRMPRVAVPAVAALALLVFAGVRLLEHQARARPVQPEKSIAVLPFINDSPDQENTYFINGVMEEILGSLQKIKALRVISRTSVEQYRERKKSIRQIAKELGVNYIVEGSAQKYGNAFRLRAQLIMAEHESHLWGESFQQKITDVEDIFNIQIKIAKSIAEELKAVISPQEQRLIEKIPAADLEVYDKYLKARSYWTDFTKESLYKAIEYLNSAIEKNPDWAPLYAGLAEVWIWIQQAGWEPPSVVAPKILENLKKAMELDPDLAEVHYQSAVIAQLVEWDWEKSEKEFLKSLAINPNNPLPRLMYAQLLLILNRGDESLAQREVAIRLDPLNYSTKLLYIGTLVQAGDCKTSISLMEEALATHPADFNINGMLEFAAYKVKDYDRVIRALKYSLPFPFEEDKYKEIERIYRERGIVPAYEGLMKHMEKYAENNYIGFSDMAARYMIADQPDKAMDWIEKGFESHDPIMTYITKSAQLFEPLFGNPRFIAICEKMNLPLPK
jgi:eukaryotic-like serine/threonine-protein kinase